MKLRNKNTGKVIDSNNAEIMIIVPNEIPIAYLSISSLNEDWEDYKSSEPLIKDEKIRKVLKAWAVVNSIVKVIYNEDKDFLEDEFCSGVTISFDNIKALENLENDKSYTIEELCGEDE